MTATITTSGLQNLTNPAAALFTGQWALASGTGDIIAASYPTPNQSLTDGLLLGFRGFISNLTTTPTFSPDGLAPAVIVLATGIPLVAADISVGGEYLVRYNLANNVWTLITG
jgi:hypothetical protein